MRVYEYFLNTRFLLFAFISLLFYVDADAQVVVDLSKITCNQFATYKIKNPESIAIWLDGYYHGTRQDMKVDIQTLIADTKKVEAYCVSKPDVMLVQAVNAVLGISLGQ
jgi:acid stress chaperone HdeB